MVYKKVNTVFQETEAITITKIRNGGKINKSASSMLHVNEKSRNNINIKDYK